jgi:hypothetical protein
VPVTTLAGAREAAPLLQERKVVMKPFVIGAIVMAAIAALGWLGVRIPPAAYPPFDAHTPAQELRPLPAGLPAPVDRFYRLTYGDSLPIITSAVVSGRGTMAPFGVALPMRFQMLYTIGQDYRAQFEATFFGLPIMRAVETYINGHGVGQTPAGTDQGVWFDQAINVRIWCELLQWMPAALLSEPRVAWEPIDETMAVLRVPFGEQRQTIIVRFDSESGRLRYFEAMKGRSATDELLWINGIWVDQGKPWITLNIEEQRYNLPVADAIRHVTE